MAYSEDELYEKIFDLMDQMERLIGRLDDVVSTHGAKYFLEAMESSFFNQKPKIRAAVRAEVVRDLSLPLNYHRSTYRDFLYNFYHPKQEGEGNEPRSTEGNDRESERRDLDPV